MFIRMLFLHVDLWFMFECIASDYKDIFPFPSEDKMQSCGSWLEVRVVFISFCIFPSLPSSEDLIKIATSDCPQGLVNASTVQISHPACRATTRCWSTSPSVPMFSALSPALSASTSSFELLWEGRSRRCSQLSLRIMLLFAALLFRCCSELKATESQLACPHAKVMPSPSPLLKYSAAIAQLQRGPL